MSFFCRLMVVIAVLAASGTAGFAAQPFTLTDLNGSGVNSQAWDVSTVNGSAVVVGQIQNGARAYTDAAVWTKSGSGFAMTDIGTLLYNAYNSAVAGTGYNWYNSVATGINASGQSSACGAASTAITGSGPRRSFMPTAR